VSAGQGMSREGFAAGLIRAGYATGALKASSTIRVNLPVRSLQRDLGKLNSCQFGRLTVRRQKPCDETQRMCPIILTHSLRLGWTHAISSRPDRSKEFCRRQLLVQNLLNRTLYVAPRETES
jgi:hypothetical protein